MNLFDESSDFNSRYEHLSNDDFTMQGTADCIDIPDDFKEDYAEFNNMSDEEIFALIHDDFESVSNHPEDQETENRYDLCDEQTDPLDIDGEEIPAETCDFMAVDGTAYYFQAKPTVTEEKYDTMVYNTDTDSYNY